MGKRFMVMLLLLAQGCISGDENFRDVLSAPHKFHLQQVIITGIFHNRLEDHAIYLTNGSSKAEAVWVEFSEFFLNSSKFDNLDGKTVRLTGIFMEYNKGHLDQYAGSLEEASIVIH
jgi:hypothetical protein